MYPHFLLRSLTELALERVVTLPGRHRLRIGPTSISSSLALPSLALPARITGRILPIPPAPAVFDQRVIDVRTIFQDHISNSSVILVLAECLERDFLPKYQL